MIGDESIAIRIHSTSAIFNLNLKHKLGRVCSKVVERSLVNKTWWVQILAVPRDPIVSLSLSRKS